MLMITAKAIDFLNSVFMINKELLESVKRLELCGGLLFNEREKRREAACAFPSIKLSQCLKRSTKFSSE